MVFFRNVCVVNIFLVIFTSGILSQESGKFWWLQKNPQFGRVLYDSTGSAEESDSENNIDYDERNNGDKGVLQVTSSVNSIFALQPEEPKFVNMQGKGLNMDDEDDCVCVDYYLCSSNNTIITNGDGGIIDVRMGERCPGIQVCCKIPDVTAHKPVTQKPMKCGERGGGIVTRVLDQVEDDSTQFSEFPWMLAIVKNEVKDGEVTNNLFQCGASLIHPQVVLTAAHCVNSGKERSFKVRAGEYDTRGSSEPIPHQDRNVIRIILHPDFYSGALYNDIALLVLNQPLQLVVNVMPICLPQQDADFTSKMCVATGWGRNAFGKDGQYQKTLKKVELPVVPSDVCQNRLRTTRLGRYFILDQSFVCAGGEPGKDTCRGDGGGPLACYDPAIHAYVQVGIVSWGISCGDRGIPAVYTNVPRFRKWIDDSLEQLGFV